MAMDPDEVYETVARAFRRLDDSQRQTVKDVTELKAQLAELVELLIARGGLTEGHRRHLGQVVRSVDDGRRKIRLRPYIDKYTMETGDQIDCAARLHLCKARCCTFQVELTAQDVEEGKVRWDLNEPYMKRREADGQCTHYDRKNGGCTIYEYRPATCRTYSCREDHRVWLDFEKMIPAPLLE